jgi:predicted PurR-regulated permease PerM
VLRFRRAFVFGLVVSVSLLFAVMVRGFILSLFLAAIFAGLAYPLYAWILERVKGRAAPAAVLTTLVLLLGLALPIGGFLAVVATEAVQVSRGAEGWLQEQAPRIEAARSLLARIPFADRAIPEGEDLVQEFRQVAGRAGGILWGTVTGAARGTASFVLQLFVLLYAFFFFLIGGPSMLRTATGYLPLGGTEKEKLLERFLSVARATLKGSLLIGLIQGTAAGLAFWAAGVPGPAFWGTVMVVLAVLPAVGAAIVWVPAVAYLLLIERFVAGILLLLWCGLVVGTVDNLLRPRLIGKDARMSDLMIFISTLGGITLFGAVGFIVGPIVAALFVTVWHIYGETFRDWLPADRGT